ncbi:TetR/AcrR family transcriptional regulator [Rhodococcus sp. IEGM 1366]|uniref:TetR/AcrR family transcriptional regulator n=1 Tax=Rhodococcus sp. IEGM 1366 TaxID=3082223 RepID=UPI0029538F87|nr:TetR/AcrR family transcriptional regulator [Rhodococcus sp. IEGM 1366]MDV8070649.1 TetR/AcrR family transcriptional regulator [Rhodococcus sp. IEGM 1366]
MTVDESRGRASAWGADLPASEEQARERIMRAAERCYAEMGPARTKMTHIAAAAGIHRTTMYSYFPHREAVFDACYIRASRMIAEASEQCWDSDLPVLEQLVEACVEGLSIAREMPSMRVLLGPEGLPLAHAASTSEGWRSELSKVVGDRLAVGVATGEVRSDVAPNVLADWVTRVCLGLIDSPVSAEDGGDRMILKLFLTRSLRP